jgi:hypothetical protein
MVDPSAKCAPRDPVPLRAAPGSLPVPDVKLPPKAKGKPLLLSDLFRSVTSAKPKGRPPAGPTKSTVPARSKARRAADPAKPGVAAAPRKRKMPMGKRKLLGIDGICRQGEELFVFVRFEDSEKAESIPVQLMHEHYLNQLLAFYEEHIILSSAGQ